MVFEHDPLVLSYSHLRDLPRAADALLLVRKVASVVKPIMRARGWRVHELAEFYPDQANLLGLNINAGQRILLRLRYPRDRTLFLPTEEIIDTMLHELSHIVHGPHDSKFHALWNQLRDEHEGLVRKGYTGEGFLSPGQKLGGRQIPMHEARRLARAAAEKRHAEKDATSHSRQLGGIPVQPGQDIRRVIADAAERRGRRRRSNIGAITDLHGCGSSIHDKGEIRKISDAATQSGFCTQAEEDAANEAAIAQALWELVQEDQRVRLGSAYVPPSADNPTGSGGAATPWSWTEDDVAFSNGSSELQPTALDTTASATVRGWICSTCTLHNPSRFLCCDACGSERSALTGSATASASGVLKPISPSNRIRYLKQRPRVEENARPLPMPTSLRPTRRPTPTRPTWLCECGNVMEHQWWACAVCGRIKQSSS